VVVAIFFADEDREASRGSFELHDCSSLVHNRVR
jgi:hypothetical protein